jgi:hypothetical protein
MRRIVGLAVLMALAVMLTGCAHRSVDDPVAVMLDRDKDPARRLSAAKQLGSISDSSYPMRSETAMHRVLWSDGQPTDLRLWSMDRLIEYDADAFWMIARRRIRGVDLWPVLEPLIERSAKHGDPGFTVALVRSYIRESQIYPDDQRPERAAIKALNPELSLEQAVWGVFVSEDHAITTAARVDAWALTNRLVGPDQSRAMLLQMDSQQPLILDLKAARWLDVLPVSREAVLWLMQIRSESGGAYWDDAQKLAGGLTDKQRQGLELRHLPALHMADVSDPSLSKASLYSRIARRLASSRGSVRTEAGVAMRLPSETLTDHADSLSFADLLTIELLIDALADRSLVRELFSQADRDRADTATEHGGVLIMEADRIKALTFPPTIRAHDEKFYSSDALILRMYTGLAHYHFHAQRYPNAAYAGPGVGDLAFADRLRPTAVVFTFIDRDTLNVDYYQAGGIVVDLGTIKR